MTCMFTFCFRLFGSGGSCAACGQNIPAHEMVMRVHGSTYHLKCFTCAACNTQLTPGNRYAIINGNIVCEQDYPKVTKGQINGNSRNSSKIHGMMTKIWKLRKTSDFTILPSLNSKHFSFRMDTWQRHTCTCACLWYTITMSIITHILCAQ